MRSNKFILAIVLVLILVLSALTFTACNDKNDTVITVSDDDYTLTLSGMVNADGTALADAVITKKQIKELYKTNPVNYTSESPAFASDKTDDNGNPIPHTLKGVYLEDLIAAYTEGAPITSYGSLTLNATDGYVTMATEDVFNSATRGSKMIIAFEYDGITLGVKQKSGALRAVFPNQIANVWAKKLNVIEFSTDILQTPQVQSFSIIETLIKNSAYVGNYNAVEADGSYTYSGLKVSELIKADVYKNVGEFDKMCVVAWDFDDASNKYKEYVAWTKYDVYNGGYILTEGTKTGDPDWTLDRKPVFDGPDFNAGMTVKNVLALSAFKSSVVCMETAMKRFDPDEDGVKDSKFSIKDLLVLLNMYDDDNIYTVTKADNGTATLTHAEITAAKVSKNSASNYVLTYNTNIVIEFTGVSVTAKK